MADEKKSAEQVTLDRDAHGSVTISDNVVGTIAGMAARKLDGVHDLGRGTLGRVAKAFAGDSPTRGVSVEVGTREVAIDLQLVVEYGHSIPDVCKAVRAAVNERVGQMTGLIVKELNIDVTGIHFPEEERAEPAPRVN